jgi:SAM-dependent methyltransferase
MVAASDAQQFYDELSPYYHLIYEDWEASMRRQGAALESIIRAELGDPGMTIRVLDAACGIGTQALPLADRGFDVTARDLSPGAIARLRREAGDRHLRLNAATADMRHVAESVSGPYDVVLACDNSLPHLLTDEDILTALRQFRQVLRPGGLCLCSVRDYDAAERGVDALRPYGRRFWGTEVFTARQEWHWQSRTHYQVTIILDQEGPDGPKSVLRAVGDYYAISIGRLLELMVEAGFIDCRRDDDLFFQPILLGRSA